MKAELRRTPFRGFAGVFRFFLLVSAAIGFFSSAARAQTVDEVIAKNIQAKGGADKLKSVRTIRTTAKYSQGPFHTEFRQENNSAEHGTHATIIQGQHHNSAHVDTTEWVLL